MLTGLLVTLAALPWQVLPLVVVSGSDPVLCGYVFRQADGLELRVEKGVREGQVFTALEANAVALELLTASFDSRRDLPAVAAPPGRVRLEGDLQTVDAGGALFAELGVRGGTLRIGQPLDAAAGTGEGRARLQWTSYELPAPMPRDITAIYLNCAGDLIRP